MFCLIGASVQVKVADALKKRAPDTKPDFFINVGDNFYWGGVNTVTQFHYGPLCSTMFHHVPLSNYHMLHYYFMSTSVSFLGWSRNQTRMLPSCAFFFAEVPEANPRCESYWIKEYPVVNHWKTIGKTIGKGWLNGFFVEYSQPGKLM